MNTIVKITSLLLCVFLCNACSNNEKNYEVYINNEGYNLEEEIYVEVNLKTSNDNINVCPILKVEKEGEEDISEIADSITFSTDSVEFMNLYPVEFSEKYNDGYWSFETQLSNDGEDIDLSNGDTVERIKLFFKKPGKYKINLEENTELPNCKYIYGKDLYLTISK